MSRQKLGCPGIKSSTDPQAPEALNPEAKQQGELKPGGRKARLQLSKEQGHSCPGQKQPRQGAGTFLSRSKTTTTRSRDIRVPVKNNHDKETGRSLRRFTSWLRSAACPCRHPTTPPLHRRTVLTHLFLLSLLRFFGHPSHSPLLQVFTTGTAPASAA